MNFVYLLQSESSRRFYVGSTDNLNRRVAEHQRGKSLATRGRDPWNLVYTEQFDSLADARRREFEIKRWKSAQAIRFLIAKRSSEPI
jgi:putative endonuclease